MNQRSATVVFEPSIRPINRPYADPIPHNTALATLLCVRFTGTGSILVRPFPGVAVFMGSILRETDLTSRGNPLSSRCAQLVEGHPHPQPFHRFQVYNISVMTPWSDSSGRGGR